MKIRFFNPALDYLAYKDEYDEAWHRVNERGDLILREDVEKFEENLAKFTGKKYAVSLNSGTDALYLSLWALGIGKGDEVIVPSHTFVATAQVVQQLGATPILVDVHYNFLVGLVDDYITENTKAIIPVHLTGSVVNHLLLPSGISIVEDAAQALGAKGVGYGITQCYSFYPAKILGAKGDAGAITTDDLRIANEIKELRNHYKKDYSEWGINSRMDNLQAALLNVKFKYIDDILRRRQDIAEMYRALHGEVIILPEYSEGRVWQDYVIRTNKRDELYKYLKEQSIETMKNDYPFPIPKLPNSIRIESETLRIPCNEHLTDEEVGYVIEKINEFFR